MPHARSGAMGLWSLQLVISLWVDESLHESCRLADDELDRQDRLLRYLLSFDQIEQ
jgi:hypothetical protein